ncbi:DUF3164 family protein [Zoogloea sp.]|uniref:DUF3164 family protein n=1 Tax=Zoogloea sp. TaxID=49181 RepID=UPI001ACEA1A2|nr:DUF3164 family protein [Zoogloea sp.]MBN8283412.1 DUF3164 family protein [Zoogloea sp.]
MADTAIPEGYLLNPAGHLVPREQVREQDLLRDQVATELADRALNIHHQLKAFKARALADIADLVSVSAEKYKVAIGGEKGNVTITTFDGKYKVVRAYAERITFTEEIEAAKALINACIIRWSEGANDNIRALVDRAFRTDSKGQIKTAAVLELLRLEITDDEWERAMDAIRDSIQSTGTSVYVRVYQRIDGTDQYRAISLDLATA